MNLTGVEQLRVFLISVRDIKPNAQRIISESKNKDTLEIINGLDFSHADILAEYYVTLGEAYRIKKYYVKAIKCINQGIRHLKKINVIDSKLYIDLHYKLGEYSYFNGQKKKALKEFKSWAKFHFQQNQFFEDIEYYSFRPDNKHTLADLKECKITFSDPQTFNDPVDPLIAPWFETRKLIESNAQRREIIELEEKALSSIKIRCFICNKIIPKTEDEKKEYKNQPDSEPYKQVLMWSHYTNKHQGICIKYKFPVTYDLYKQWKEPIWLERVEYKNKFYLENLGKAKDLSITDAFFTKNSVWKYENETRLLFYDNKNKKKHIGLDIKEDWISDIYFGVNCSSEYKKAVKECLKGKNIAFHQMKKDLNDIFTLKDGGDI